MSDLCHVAGTCTALTQVLRHEATSAMVTELQNECDELAYKLDCRDVDALRQIRRDEFLTDLLRASGILDTVRRLTESARRAEELEVEVLARANGRGVAIAMQASAIERRLRGSEQ